MMQSRCPARAGAIVVAFVCCLPIGLAIGTSVRAAELSLPIQTTIKSIAAPKSVAQPTAMVNPMQRTASPAPTLPSGKLPQYQLGREQLARLDDADLKNPKRRLLVALPDQLLLVEASITIDGQPFAMARERRIQTILQTAGQGVEKREVKTEAPTAIREVAQQDESESEDDTDEDAETEDSEAEEEVEVIPPTLAEFARVADTEDFIRRYYATTGGEPSADEIRWLITHRVDGPVLLMLSDNFQRFRAGERPAFNVLDRDLDGTVSKDELVKAVDSFERCDENQNDIVEYKELETVANRVRQSGVQGGKGKLVSQIPTTVNAAAVYRRLRTHYPAKQSDVIDRFDKNTNGKFDSDEIESFTSVDADLQLSVDFNTTDAAKSKISITGVGEQIANQVFDPESNAGSISLRIGGPTESDSVGTTIAFSAIQKRASDQIAIGAVSDGYPILPTLDPNQDGRFTVRERRQLLDRVKKIDRNHDGSITSDEVQSTIRVCFALGPNVHQELASLRTTQSRGELATIVGPEWFKRMDRNQDNDISVREFSGNEEQFADLDIDGDKLISAAEAKALDTSHKAAKPKTESKPESEPESDPTIESDPTKIESSDSSTPKK